MASPMAPEIHIAGVLVLVAPGRGPAVAGALSRLPGVEVRAVTQAGKLVVVCECTSGKEVLGLIGQMRELAGVLDAALVYQHAESSAAMQEEIDDETDTPGIH